MTDILSDLVGGDLFSFQDKDFGSKQTKTNKLWLFNVYVVSIRPARLTVDFILNTGVRYHHCSSIYSASSRIDGRTVV